MKNFKGKAIYNPSDKAGEYSYWACNFYVGCSNGCEYCYCKKGILKAAMGMDTPQLKKCFKDEKHALKVFESELSSNIVELQKHGLFFSFTTDPMLPETIYLTIMAMCKCLQYDVPVKILTKNAAFLDYSMFKAAGMFDFTEETKRLIAFGFTLTGHDELEKSASTNVDRVKAMRKLSKAGFKTWASIEPIIDFESAKECIKATFGYCDLYKIGLMSGKKYDAIDAQTFVEWLNELSDSNYPKIYLKESLQKLTGYKNEDLEINFVDRDFNVFAT